VKARGTSTNKANSRPRSFKEIEKAARSDPDALPMTDAELGTMQRIPLAKHARWKAGLTQEAFAARYLIPIGTLRDWEQGRTLPDASAQAYLQAIAADPKGVLTAGGAEQAGEIARLIRAIDTLTPGLAIFVPSACAERMTVQYPSSELFFGKLSRDYHCDVAFDEHPRLGQGVFLVKR
jgi:putative transcriptional regulator